MRVFFCTNVISIYMYVVKAAETYLCMKNSYLTLMKLTTSFPLSLSPRLLFLSRCILDDFSELLQLPSHNNNVFDLTQERVWVSLICKIIPIWLAVNLMLDCFLKPSFYVSFLYLRDYRLNGKCEKKIYLRCKNILKTLHFLQWM